MTRKTQYECNGCDKLITSDHEYFLLMDCFRNKAFKNPSVASPEIKDEVHFHNLDCLNKWLKWKGLE